MAEAPVAAVDAALAAAQRTLADLRQDADSIAESTALVPDDEHDAEGATVGFERARVGALIAATERHIAQLEAARLRAGSGTYGSCERCRGDIGLERLEALPATRWCVHCAAGPAG